VDIQMPQLGETVTEGTITRWLKSVGDHVEADEPLFEVSTDKVDSEVPAPAAGTLTEILVQEGETAEVGARLAVIADAEGAAAPAAAAAAAPAAGPPRAEAQAPAAAPEPEAPAPPQPAPPEPAPAPPAEPERPAAAVTPPAPAPAPPREAEQPAAAAAPAPAPSAPAAAAAGGALMSPVVRRLLSDYGLDAEDVKGTGEGGRITRNDVLEAAGRQQRAPQAPAAPTAPAAPAAPAPAAAPPQAAPPQAAPAPAPPSPPREAERPAAVAPSPAVGDETIPFDNIRRRTAEHMLRSKATSPHAYTSVEVDYERVDRVRRGAQEEWKAREGFPLTYLPFVVRAFCDTVEDYPHVNASVDGENLVVHHDIHVGIAVDLDFQGLVAPVIRSADGKRLRLISREIHDLATRARNKRLMPDEIMGGTFTITNPGPFGTHVTLPIINQPQVAILSTDGIRKRPWVVTGPDGDDSLAIRHVGVLALGWDHRAFDGAYAAAFLRAMKELIETHDWEAELA
jgi:pyruvate dehydrogenase E2 component (dihydrolipoyllysine-residue acetyltransferase)